MLDSKEGVCAGEKGVLAHLERSRGEEGGRVGAALPLWVEHDAAAADGRGGVLEERGEPLELQKEHGRVKVSKRGFQIRTRRALGGSEASLAV